MLDSDSLDQLRAFIDAADDRLASNDCLVGDEDSDVSPIDCRMWLNGARTTSMALDWWNSSFRPLAECRIAIAALRHVVSVRCNLRCAAQILEHVLGFRRSGAFTQEIIRGAQGAYLFSDRGRDELVQRYAFRGRQFGGCLLHRRGKFQWIGVLAHFLIYSLAPRRFYES
jgi:hypothetical protein